MVLQLTAPCIRSIMFFQMGRLDYKDPESALAKVFRSCLALQIRSDEKAYFYGLL
jgi:hypothetical protein